MIRQRGLKHIVYLYRVRKDFSLRHLLKCLILGWWPMPDRFFVSSPFLPWLRERLGDGMPHKCSECFGTGRIYAPWFHPENPLEDRIDVTEGVTRDCPVCQGTGYVREPKYQ